MKVIYKYELESFKYQSIKIPKDAKILTAQIQYDSIMLWAIVNPDNTELDFNFYVAPTGQPFPDDINIDDFIFINTVQIGGGSLIFHVFKEMKE